MEVKVAMGAIKWSFWLCLNFVELITAPWKEHVDSPVQCSPRTPSLLFIQPAWSPSYESRKCDINS